MDKLRLELGGGGEVYLQIVRGVRGRVESGELVAGERLPAVRELARELGVSPGTVARAYAELARQGVIVTRRGGGSFVAGKAERVPSPEERLRAALDRSIVEGLSLGYTPEELEALFILHLAKWREEREKKGRGETLPARTGKINFVGSHDLALELLTVYLGQYRELSLQTTFAGSLGGLIALEEGKAHIAGVHLFDEETEQYNLPFIRRILPGREVAMINLARRVQGLMVKKGNPKGIRSWEDLTRPDVVFVNRQKGSGTRVFLDSQLKRHGIDTKKIRGYAYEAPTHISVAVTVAGGTADVGLGIEAAARALGLDFVPLAEEPYDLVLPGEYVKEDFAAKLIETLNSSQFKKAVSALAGYVTEETGKLRFVS